MKIAIIAITEDGSKLAEYLANKIGATILSPKAGIKPTLDENWKQFDGFICIMAAGIVVRSIASLLVNKKVDPAVIVLDEKGQHVISLLSGHLGGANKLANDIALLTNGTPVITTASDTLQLVALDLWCKKQNLAVNSDALLTKTSAKLVNEKKLQIYSEFPISSLPAGLVETDDHNQADIIISINTDWQEEKLILHPRCIVAGLGCRRGTAADQFETAFTELFHELNISQTSICRLSSVEQKSDEYGLLRFAQSRKLPISFYTSEQINTFTNLDISQAALKAVGAIGVAEPCALLGAETNKTENLICTKRKWKNLTIALAQAPFTLSRQVLEP